jgi:DNA topoisomerase-1
MAEAKRNLRAAIAQTAARLGNTAAICRKCYVHPDVLELYLDGELALDIKSASAQDASNGSVGLIPEEAAVLALLRSRSRR